MRIFLVLYFAFAAQNDSVFGARLRNLLKLRTRKPEPSMTAWTYKHADMGGCAGYRPLLVIRTELKSRDEDSRCVESSEFRKLGNYIKATLQKLSGSFLRATGVIKNALQKFVSGCSIQEFKNLWETIPANGTVVERCKPCKTVEEAFHAFEQSGGSAFLNAWYTSHKKRAFPLLPLGQSCLEGCSEAVDQRNDLDVCNPDLDVPDTTQLKWVPLSKLRIPQRGARAMMTAPPGGLNSSESLPTIIGNIDDKPDPRGINCLMVCQETNKNTGESIYWSEGTRRVIGWLLGGVPDEFSTKDLIPVKMVNCLRTKEDKDAGTNLFVNDDLFGEGQEGEAILRKLHVYKNVWSQNGTLNNSELVFWNEQTPILMYSLADPGSDPVLQQEHQAYRRLKEYIKDRTSGSKKFWLSFAEDVSSTTCKNGQCGSNILEDCKNNGIGQGECNTKEISNQIKAAALTVVDDWSKHNAAHW